MKTSAWTIAPLALLTLVSAGCGGTGGVAVTPLPAVTPDPGVPALLVETPAGDLVATFIDATVFHLAPGADAWAPVSAPPVQLAQRDDLAGGFFGLGPGGVTTLEDGALAQVTPQPPLPPAQVGMLAIRGRAADGTYVMTEGAYADVTSATAFVGHWSPGEATWTTAFSSIPHEHTLAVSDALLAGDGRLLYRVPNGGVWTLDRTTAATAELVACDHAIFAPSHPDYTPCEEDVVLFRGADGDVLLLDARHAVWRLGATPELLVEAGLPAVPRQDSAGYTLIAVGRAPYAAPGGELWLAVRWGDNSESDRGYLFRAHPGGAWSVVDVELPRTPFVARGDGAGPVIFSGVAADGFRAARITP